MLSAVSNLFSTHTGDGIVPPSGGSKPIAQLRPEHFVVEPGQLRYPSTLDFSHAAFKLRDISLLESVPKGAPQVVNLGGNELTSLEIVNRFQQLRTLVAAVNSLQVGGGLVLRLPKLMELDLASNRLVAIPPLGELPQLHILRLQRNQIGRNWGELGATKETLRELDVSHNRLSWQQPTGEFDAALQVLASLKKLKELRLGANPISDTPALRYLVLTYTPRLSHLDGLAVTEHERRGRANRGLPGAPLAMQAAMIVPHDSDASDNGNSDDDDGGANGECVGSGGGRMCAQEGDCGVQSSGAVGARARRCGGRERNQHDGSGGGISLEALSTTRNATAAAGMASHTSALHPSILQHANTRTAEHAGKQMDMLAPDSPMRNSGLEDDGAGVGIGSSRGGGPASATLVDTSLQPWGGAGGDAMLLAPPRSVTVRGMGTVPTFDTSDGGSDDDDDECDGGDDEGSLPEWVRRVTGSGGSAENIQRRQKPNHTRQKQHRTPDGGAARDGEILSHGSLPPSSPRAPAWRAEPSADGARGLAQSFQAVTVDGNEDDGLGWSDEQRAESARAQRQAEANRREAEEEAERVQMRQLELEAFEAAEREVAAKARERATRKIVPGMTACAPSFAPAGALAAGGGAPSNVPVATIAPLDEEDIDDDRVAGGDGVASMYSTHSQAPIGQPQVDALNLIAQADDLLKAVSISTEGPSSCSSTLAPAATLPTSERGCHVPLSHASGCTQSTSAARRPSHNVDSIARADPSHLMPGAVDPVLGGRNGAGVAGVTRMQSVVEDEMRQLRMWQATRATESDESACAMRSDAPAQVWPNTLSPSHASSCSEHAAGAQCRTGFIAHSAVHTPPPASYHAPPSIASPAGHAATADSYGACGMYAASSPSAWSVGTSNWGRTPPSSGTVETPPQPRHQTQSRAMAAACAALAHHDARYEAYSEAGYSNADDASLSGRSLSASLAGTSLAGYSAAEERIAAAAAAAAGAVVASECIKWRARAERLESERRGQLSQQQELHETMRCTEKEYREAEAELQSLRDQIAKSGADVLSQQRAEVLNAKQALHRERQETRAADDAVSAARKELAEIERACVLAEQEIAAIEPMVLSEEALRQAEEDARLAQEESENLACALSEVEAKLARARAHQPSKSLQQHEHVPAHVGLAGNGSDGAMRSDTARLDEVRAEIQKLESELRALDHMSGAGSRLAKGAHLSTSCTQPPASEVHLRSLTEADAEPEPEAEVGAEAGAGAEADAEAGAGAEADAEAQEEEEEARNDSLRRQLADLRRLRRESGSARCVWRQAAWQAAWAILAAASRCTPTDTDAACAHVDTIESKMEDEARNQMLHQVEQVVETQAVPRAGVAGSVFGGLGAGIFENQPHRAPSSARGESNGSQDDDEPHWVAVGASEADTSEEARPGFAWLEAQIADGGASQAEEGEASVVEQPIADHAELASAGGANDDDGDCKETSVRGGAPGMADQSERKAAEPIHQGVSHFKKLRGAITALEIEARDAITRARAEVEAEAEAVSQAADITNDASAALDWAAAMERDAFEAASMRYEQMDEVDNDAASATTDGTAVAGGHVAGAHGVCVMWRSLARREAQRLLRLNDEVNRQESAWQVERERWLALKAEVQAELRREARQQVKDRGSPSAIASLHGSESCGDSATLYSELAEAKRELRLTNQQASNMKRERLALEKELARRKDAVADLEARVSRLRGLL